MFESGLLLLFKYISLSLKLTLLTEFYLLCIKEKLFKHYLKLFVL